MRPLELVLLAATLAAAAAAAVPGARRAVRPLALSGLVAALAQVVVGGPRWQLVPLYLAVLVLAALSLAGSATTPRAPRTTSVGAIALAVAGALLGILLPVPGIPAPPGDVAVGTVAWTLTDPTRPETATADPDDARTIVVQAWYPTSDPSGPRDRITHAPWAFARAAGRWLELPPVMLTHLGLATTAARVGAPVSALRPLPVVVYSHGWGGFRKAQVGLMESLAARGNLVLAVDHTYAAIAAESPEGVVVELEPDLLPEDAPDATYDAAATALERRFADDLELTLSELADGTATPAEVQQAADLDRLALLGHSTGGGAAIWTCAEEPRCRGVVGYDPWVEPLPAELLEQGLGAPLLSIRSAAWDGNDNDAVLQGLHAATDVEARVTITGTEHRDVTVLSFLTPLASRVGLTGPTDPRRTHDVVEELTADFLDVVLDEAEVDGLQEVTAEPPAVVEVEPPAR